MKSLQDYILLEKNWDKYISLTYDDIIKNAIYDYVSGNTVGVNNDLRKNINRGSKNVLKILDNAFNSKYAKTGKLDVYRTVTWDYLQNVYKINKNNINNFIGKELTIKNYMSTCKKEKSPWGSWTNDEVLLHITSNKKINYIDINSIFDSGEIDCYEQEEILLPRNLTLKIISYSDKKIFTIKLEII